MRGGATTTLRRRRRRARRSRRRPGLRRIFVEPSPAAAVRDHSTRHSRELSAASELECSSSRSTRERGRRARVSSHRRGRAERGPSRREIQRKFSLSVRGVGRSGAIPRDHPRDLAASRATSRIAGAPHVVGDAATSPSSERGGEHLVVIFVDVVGEVEFDHLAERVRDVRLGEDVLVLVVVLFLLVVLLDEGVGFVVLVLGV